MFTTLLASAVLPAIIDFFKGSGSALGRKYFGMSVDDQIKIQNADVEKLKALSTLDNPYGTPDQWVVNLRGAFRYVAAALIIMIGAVVLYLGITNHVDNIVDIGFTLVGTPFSFIFGERLYLGLKGAGNK